MIKERIANLKAMDDFICNEVGDEEIWYEWITYGVQDEATEEDFKDMAEDYDCYSKICKIFEELTKDYDTGKVEPYCCEICKRHTNWDESFGMDSFIVCNNCCNKVVKKVRVSDPDADAVLTVLNVFFAIAKTKDEKNK